MTESRIKEYKDSELEQLFKQVEKTLIIDKRLKEAEDDQLEQKINDWVTSTIDDWRSSWDDTPDGAHAAKYDLETAYDWFWNNIADFEDKYDYVVEEDDQKFDDCLTQTVNNYVEETLQDLRDSWDHFDDDGDDDIWDPDEEDDDEYWDEVHASDSYFSESQLKEAGNVTSKAGQISNLNLQLGKAKKRVAELNRVILNSQEQIKASKGKNDPNSLAQSQQAQAALTQAQAQMTQAEQKVQALTQQLQALTGEGGEGVSDTGLQIDKNDIQYGKNYLTKLFNQKNFDQQISSMLPKISKSFGKDTFHITKITPTNQPDSSSVTYKVDFEIVPGSKKMAKLTASTDPTTINALRFLEELEEQDEELLEEAFADAVKQGWEKVKQGAAKAKEVGKAAIAKTAELGSKAIDKAKELAPKVADKAKELGTKVADKAKELGAKAKDAVKAGVEEIKQNAAEKTATNEQSLKAYLPKILNKNFTDSAEINGKNCVFSIENVQLNLKESANVASGSFEVTMAANGIASSAQAEQGNTETAETAAEQPTAQAQPAQAAQPTTQGQAQPAQASPNGTNANTINFYGYPSQQNQPQQKSQNNGTPFWYNDMSRRQQKKFIRNQLKNPGQTNNLGNRVWDWTYGNGGKNAKPFA